MTFRVATLNIEQDHNRWDERQELVVEQLGQLKPDLFGLNEICVPLETGRWLQRVGREQMGIGWTLVQRARLLEADGLLTRFPVVETADLDYRARDSAALVARVEIEGRLLDVFVTHLYGSANPDPLRHFQVQQLLGWMDTRDDVEARIVLGDFNATLDMPSAREMATKFAPTQTQHTAFTPLHKEGQPPSHPDWDRFDRCIDYIWVAGPLRVLDSGLCFDRPDPTDSTLWPSDHLGVWADLEFE